eukprot:4332501-Prymnesium_polylepis.1
MSCCIQSRVHGTTGRVKSQHSRARWWQLNSCAAEGAREHVKQAGEGVRRGFGRFAARGTPEPPC